MEQISGHWTKDDPRKSFLGDHPDDRSTVQEAGSPVCWKWLLDSGYEFEPSNHKESFLAGILLLEVNKGLGRAVRMACIYTH